MKPLPPNTVIHCPTKELDQQVCKIFDDAGLMWNSGSSYLKQNMWEVYGGKTCYNLNGARFARLEYYQEKGFAIISAEDFIKMNEVDSERKLLKAFYKFVFPNGNRDAEIDDFLASKRKPKFSLICADGIEIINQVPSGQ